MKMHEKLLKNHRTAVNIPCRMIVLNDMSPGLGQGIKFIMHDEEKRTLQIHMTKAEAEHLALQLRVGIAGLD